MINEVSGLAGRVAEVAVLTIITVTRDSNVVLIGIASIMFMTAKAAEILEISRINMTRGAVIPLAGMLTGKNGEESVVIGQHGRAPGTHLMAFITVARESRGHVIWPGDLEKQLLVAFHTAGCFEREIAARQSFVTTLAVG